MAENTSIETQDLMWKTRKGKNHESPQTPNFITMVGGILLMGGGWSQRQNLTYTNLKEKNHGSPQTLNLITMVGGILLMGAGGAKI